MKVTSEEIKVLQALSLLYSYEDEAVLTVANAFISEELIFEPSCGFVAGIALLLQENETFFSYIKELEVVDQ